MRKTAAVEIAERKPGRPRSAAIDRSILRSALKVMARDGYARMSLETVAAEAGVTKPTLYLRHPGGKADLATAALADMRARSERPDTGDTRTDLIEQLRRLRRGLERPFGMAMVGTVLAEEHHTPQLLGRFRERVVLPRRRRVLAVLDAARGRGDVRDDADLEGLVAMLIGSYYALYLAGQRVPAQWPASLVDAVLSMAAKEGTPG